MVNPNKPEFYNKLYGGVWEINGYSQPYEYEEASKIDFYNRLVQLPFFKGSGKILDVGCGMGGIFCALPPGTGLTKFGIDFSHIAIEKTKCRIPDGTFVVGDVHSLPFENDFFQRVICTETLEHVDNPFAVVAEIFRVLQSTGKLLITVPEKSLDLPPEHWPGGVSVHINKFSVESLSAMVCENGFVIDSAEIIDSEIWLIASKSEGVGNSKETWDQERFEKILKAKETITEQLSTGKNQPGMRSPATQPVTGRVLKSQDSYSPPQIIEPRTPENSKSSNIEDIPALRQEFDTFRPHMFMIETTLACNLRCPECAIGGMHTSRKRQMMGFNQFKLLADKIRPYCQFLYPYIWGEPTLNPDIIPILRYASSFTATNISTNGMYLTESIAEDLITSGVSSIIVSIDGLTQDVYSAYRVGGDVKKAFAALETLQRYNLKHGNRVALTPQFIVFRHNQHEMEIFAAHCRSLGLEASFKSPYLRESSLLEYSDNQEYIRRHYSSDAEQKHAMRDCPDARFTFTILVDGSVVACCYDHNRATVFGNLFEQEVEEIWNSPRYRQFRWDMLTGNAPGFCTEQCLTYYKGSPERHRNNYQVETETADPLSGRCSE